MISTKIARSLCLPLVIVLVCLLPFFAPADDRTSHYVSVMFSNGYNFEFQTQSLTFRVGKAFYRVRFRDATYLICQDGHGYLYSCYRVQIQPRDPPSYVVFGIPIAYRRRGSFLSFGTDIDESGNLIDPESFRITTLAGPDNAQMVEAEER